MILGKKKILNKSKSAKFLATPEPCLFQPRISDAFRKYQDIHYAWTTEILDLYLKAVGIQVYITTRRMREKLRKKIMAVYITTPSDKTS